MLLWSAWCDPLHRTMVRTRSRTFFFSSTAAIRTPWLGSLFRNQPIASRLWPYLGPCLSSPIATTVTDRHLQPSDHIFFAMCKET
jgi:hypothetical protein